MPGGSTVYTIFPNNYINSTVTGNVSGNVDPNAPRSTMAASTNYRIPPHRPRKHRRMFPDFLMCPLYESPRPKVDFWPPNDEREHQRARRARVPAPNRMARRSHTPSQISFWTSYYGERERRKAAQSCAQ
jgi:hypothetical protein